MRETQALPTPYRVRRPDGAALAAVRSTERLAASREGADPRLGGGHAQRRIGQAAQMLMLCGIRDGSRCSYGTARLA